MIKIKSPNQLEIIITNPVMKIIVVKQSVV